MGLCENVKFLAPLRLVLIGINIIKIVVPILLIIMCMVQFVRAMTASDEKDYSEAWKSVQNKVIAALCVFLVPTIITSVISFVSDISKTTDCIQGAKASNITEMAESKIREYLSGEKTSANLSEMLILLDYIYDEDLKTELRSEISEYESGIVSNGTINGGGSSSSSKEYDLEDYLTYIVLWEGHTAYCNNGNGYMAVDINDGAITVGPGLTSPNFSGGLIVGQCYDKEMVDNVFYSHVENVYRKSVVDDAAKVGLDLSENQILALTDLAYHQGNATEAIKLLSDNKTDEFITYMKSIIHYNDNNGNTITSCGAMARRDQNLELFFTGIMSDEGYKRKDLLYYTADDIRHEGCGGFGYRTLS